MAELTLHGREVENVFDLLGQSEDGMTYALGWALTQVPPFLGKFCQKVGLIAPAENLSVDLQKSRSGFGRTDIEIVAHGTGMVIIEAKHGFVFPKEDQLRRYFRAMISDQAPDMPPGHLVVLTSFPEEVGYSDPRASLKIDDKPIPIQFLSWETVVEVAKDCISTVRGKARRILREFISYLGRCITMQDRTSNLVHVVALSKDKFGGGNITFIDVVEQYGRYFHPVGKGYPTTPPNYLGFRYRRCLQSIHFVEDVKVINQFGPYFPGTSNELIEPLFLYTLGPPIRPSHEVRSGPIRNMRCYCMLDTLLTCATVQEALKETKRRTEDNAS